MGERYVLKLAYPVAKLRDDKPHSFKSVGVLYSLSVIRLRSAHAQLT
jgi:hypothetical protein